jgi:hypothetical protein
MELSPNSPSAEQSANLGASLKELGISSWDQLKEVANNPGILKDRLFNTEAKNYYNNSFNSEDYNGLTLDDAKKAVSGDSGFLQKVENATKSLGDFAKSLVTGQPNTTAKETIALYIPDTVTAQYSANYSDVSTTEALGKPYLYAQIGASIYEKYKQAQAGASGSQLVANVLSDPTLRGFVASKLSGKLGTGDLTGLSLNAIGQAFNPQLQVLFTSIGFRTFQFDFTLTPYSQEEAVAIYNIVKTFKYRAAPEIVSNGVMTQGIYQKIPDRFNITFYSNGKENTKINKIAQCVLTNINVDYAPISWATFGDGSPVQTKLTLQFQEIELIDKNKITAGF